MRYRIVYKSRSQWLDSELESGDTGELYETKVEAEAAKNAIERAPNNDIFDSAIEAQGVEGWLEIVEEE